MMSLFSSPFYAHETSEPSLVPLFRLLDDYDHYSRSLEQAVQPEPKRRRKSSSRLPRFKPRFDVRETETTFELHGELPGVERENLNIEFTDPRTIEIRGHIERTREQQPEPKHTTPEATDSEPEKTNNHNNHHATVEDDPEEASSTASWTPVGSPKPESAKPAEETKKTSTEVQKAPRREAAPANNTGKIWLWERTVGEFSRSFTFPSDVEHEKVSASLNNGILNVTVPKQRMHTPRRITIN